jgi:NTE family protein
MTGRATMSRALVLAGGGVAGIAWELGVLLGIRDGAPTLNPAVVDADVIVGTSAGSTVAAQISAGTDLEQLFDRQLQPTSSEIEVDVDAEALMARFAAARVGASSATEVRRRIGDLALSTSTVDESVRLAAVRGRLLEERWPDRDLVIPAVDAQTGEVVIFDRTSGVSLVDAVAASCAVPGVWPPVSINGRRYMDGGTRSGTNADLAGPADRILVITPTPAGTQSALDHLDEEIHQLGEDKVMVVYADEASIAAFGNSPLSPATRRPAALAGREAGRAAAASVAGFWGA